MPNYYPRYLNLLGRRCVIFVGAHLPKAKYPNSSKAAPKFTWLAPRSHRSSSPFLILERWNGPLASTKPRACKARSWQLPLPTTGW